MDNYESLVGKYYESEFVQSLFKRYEDFRLDVITDWVNLAKIYAPSENETERAKYMVKRFKEFGIDNSYIDRTGNAVAVIEKGDGPTIVFLSTMDDLLTVADLVKSWDKPIEEEEGRLVGPGTNSSATCASLLAVARLFMLDLDFNGRLFFVGGVCEELGLKGAKEFLNDHEGEIDYFIEVSGGLGRVSYGALGINWFKVHYKGPRAHTLRGPGPNVTKGVAKSVLRVFEIPLPPESYLNVSMLGAGKVYNHRSDDGWHSVDLRSIDNNVLESLRSEIYSIVSDVAEEEQLEWWIEDFSNQPAGQLSGARNGILVKVAETATSLLGRTPVLSKRGSSNMNAAIHKGISAISVGGDRGGNRDTPDEYANIQPVLEGVKLHFLIGFILANGEVE